MWAGALGGVVLSVAWIAAPRDRSSSPPTSRSAGSRVIAIPQLVADLPRRPARAARRLGGLLYSAGAVVYATKRPSPWPRIFGFHEVFHAFVIAAAVAHFVAIAGWVIPAGAVG